ncbi:MAG: indole-3-glycerol phosphate synthase TrpC [Clostridiales Family XIII bacterium]|nr:indole-3-glycerol phosphate synthase TrpC [Clostridiales Family XIII bacterium]
MNILDNIVEEKRARVNELKKENDFAELKKTAKLLTEKGERKIFYDAVSSKEISFILEVKKASPSKGLISKNFNHLKIAKEYEKAGASAISVLTEEYFFLGKNEYLKEITNAVSIPVLRKDFIIDEYQIYETKTISAAALLLIVSILSAKELKSFLELAYELKIDVVVEVHNPGEVETAIKAGAKIIGVNNRNLKTFDVNIENSIYLRKLIPPEIIFISESGIENRTDIKRLEKNNINAVLIGESAMKAKDKITFLNELKGENEN